MKKLIITLALIVLPMTSYQTWSILSNTLTVHVSDDPTSAICYQGGAEDYSGFCVNPTSPTPQYVIKQEMLRRK